MAERLSTGFADAINETGSVKSVMANGIIQHVLMAKTGETPLNFGTP